MSTPAISAAKLGALAAVVATAALATTASAVPAVTRPGAGTAVVRYWCDPSGTVPGACSQYTSYNWDFTLTGLMPFGPAGDVGHLAATCSMSVLSGPPITCAFTATASVPAAHLRTAADSGRCTMTGGRTAGKYTLSCTDRSGSWQVDVEAAPGQNPVEPQTSYTAYGGYVLL